MIVFREWAASIIFCAGVAGVWQLSSMAFEWPVFFATLFSFIAAYIIWPSKRKGQRSDDGRFADKIELLIELPIEFFFWIVRIFGRLFGGKGDGIDLDFD